MESGVEGILSVDSLEPSGDYDHQGKVRVSGKQRDPVGVKLDINWRIARNCLKDSVSLATYTSAEAYARFDMI